MNDGDDDHNGEHQPEHPSQHQLVLPDPQHHVANMAFPLADILPHVDQPFLVLLHLRGLRAEFDVDVVAQVLVLVHDAH